MGGGPRVYNYIATKTSYIQGPFNPRTLSDLLEMSRTPCQFEAGRALLMLQQCFGQRIVHSTPQTRSVSL